MTKLLFMAVAALIGHCLAFAQNAPAGLTFQGRLTTLSGQPVANGTAKVRVRIFDAPTGGNRLWTSGEGPGQEKTVSVRNGVFAMVLSQGFNSSNNPLTIGPDVFQGGVIYVEVAPLNQPPILPRTQIWSAPWAFWAQTVSNDSITSSKLATDSQSISKITGNNLYVDAGNLGIGFPNPSHTLSMRNLSDSPISNYVRITDFSASGVNRTTLQIQRVEDLGFSISSNTSPLYLGSSQTGVPDTRDITIRAGNVGIGSTSPTQKLDVAGNMALTGLSGNWLYGGARLHIQSLGDKLFLNPNDSKPVWIGGGTGNSDLTITGSLLLTPSERVAMRQGEAGELQINSTGEWPYVWMGSRLVANNDIESLSGNILTSSSDHFIGSKTGIVYLQAGVGGTAGTLFLNPFTEGKVVVGPNRTQGNVGFEVWCQAAKPGGGSWSVLSDERLKTNIHGLERSLDQLLRLQGRSFEYRRGVDRGTAPGKQFGFIAQEVERVFPDWVTTGNDGYKLVTLPTGFSALVVEGMRELRAACRLLQREKQQLRQENSDLRRKLSSMEARLSRLEARQ